MQTLRRAMVNFGRRLPMTAALAVVAFAAHAQQLETSKYDTQGGAPLMVRRTAGLVKYLTATTTGQTFTVPAAMRTNTSDVNRAGSYAGYSSIAGAGFYCPGTVNYTCPATLPNAPATPSDTRIQPLLTDGGVLTAISGSSVISVTLYASPTATLFMSLYGPKSQ